MTRILLTTRILLVPRILLITRVLLTACIYDIFFSGVAGKVGLMIQMGFKAAEASKIL